MATDWNQDTSNQGEKMPEGYHRLKVAKVLATKGKDKEPMVNKNGDQFIILIGEDADEREASLNVTLTKKFEWKLVQLVQAAGAVDKFSKLGLDIEDFADPSASKYLEGLSLWAYVEHSGKYANFDPKTADEVPAEILQREKSTVGAGAGAGNPIDEDDIPF